MSSPPPTDPATASSASAVPYCLSPHVLQSILKNRVKVKINPNLDWSRIGQSINLKDIIKASPPLRPCCKPHLHVPSKRNVEQACTGSCPKAMELSRQLKEMESRLQNHMFAPQPKADPPPLKRHKSSSYTTDFVSARSLPPSTSNKQPIILGSSQPSSDAESPAPKNYKSPTYHFSNPTNTKFNNRASLTDTSINKKASPAVLPPGNIKDSVLNDSLKGIDPKIIEAIENEILDGNSSLSWDDIAGLDGAKQAIQEIVVWPMKRPDLFGAGSLRRPSKGVLLFGPPGTGKTLIAKCVASQVEATFFSISASSLTSKWVGEGEKLVRALFAVARSKQPSVIFIDEIDSLLTSRSEGENDASRRIKTEFLIQFDGASTSGDERLLVIGATNRPQELDEAARRRFKKRLFIPLPCEKGRLQLMKTLLRKQSHELTDLDLDHIVKKTEGYSGSDLTGVCEDAAMAPVREVMMRAYNHQCELRPVQLQDVVSALHGVRASVSRKDVEFHEKWNDEFGSKVGSGGVVVP